MMSILAFILSLFSTASFVVSEVHAPSVDVTPEVAGVSDSTVPLEIHAEPDVTLPIAVTKFNPWYKEFGTWVDDGRFLGYHAGDDIEMNILDLKAKHVVDVPVYAFADGTVQFVGWVDGYGGVVIMKHEIDGKTISSLYGHVDADAVKVKVHDKVKKGSQIAVLGEGFTHETDGRRMHLHFALWNGDDVKFPGYVETREELSGWIDPYTYLVDHGVTIE
jgi:murein DD-endopeptidase MepM/ murein hydrolase activator NlpD